MNHRQSRGQRPTAAARLEREHAVLRRRDLSVGFFTGCGGLDLGFELGGFQCVYAMDNDPYAVHAYNKNRLHGSMEAVVADIMDLHYQDVPYCDVALGGPPCTCWATIGKMEGFASRAGEAARHFIRLLTRMKPPVFVFENTAALLLPKHREAWRIIESEFQAAGYRVNARILNAADYGLPQHRRRLIVIGTRHTAPLYWPQPTHGTPTTPHVPLGSCLRGHHIGRRIDLEDLAERRQQYQSFGGTYETRSLGEPFATVTRKFDAPSSGRFSIQLNDEEAGLLSIQGALMVQGFPANTRLDGSLTKQKLVVANAVPPPLALHLAASIKQLLLHQLIHAN